MPNGGLENAQSVKEKSTEPEEVRGEGKSSKKEDWTLKDGTLRKWNELKRSKVVGS